MLSLFPDLLFLSPFGALLIRLALAGVFGLSAYRRISDPQSLIKSFGIIDGVIAIMFLVGFSTQLAALLGIVCTIAWLVKRDWNPYPRSTAALALVMCVAMLVLGAGPWSMTLYGQTFYLSFDLPL